MSTPGYDAVARAKAGPLRRTAEGLSATSLSPEASMLEVEWMFFNNWQCTELAESSSAR